MEVAKPWEDMEMEAEETEVALRGRMPRHLAATNDEDLPPIITETLTASKVVDRKDTSSDESSSSSSNGEKRTNGNGVSHAENGNGDAKSASTNGNGHSGLDGRYVDFLEPEPNAEPLKVVSHGNGDEIEIETAARDLALPLSEPGPSKESETIEYMEARLRKRIEEEFKELYLNKLSDKPGNHEFYCPNCKACITKVLVKEQDQDLELKPSPAALPRLERVDGFRCASCFTFLIPIGNWLFPSWSAGDAEEPEHDVAVSFGGLREPLLDHAVQAAAVVPGKTPESGVVTNVTTSTIQHSSEPIPSGGMTDPNQQVVTTVTTTITGPSEPVPLPPPRPWSALIFGQKNRAAIKGKTPLVPEEPIGVTNDTDKIWDSNRTETPHDNHHQSPTIVSAALTPTGSGFEAGLKLDITLPSQDSKESVPSDKLDQSNEDVLIVKTTPSESKIDVVSVSRGEMPTLQEIVVHGAGNQSVTVQSVDRAEPAQATEIAQGTRDARLVLEPGSANSWEIIKSIVYGGLVESITSLGIVTSAASGDATTLNIVALALANLIGGLFVIAHNIWELRDDKSTVRSSLTEQMVDKYQEVLGKRDNFYLHATIAILSFIVFGLVPPATYGLSFRESGDKDLKLVAVGSAALACIALLAIMKAYVQRPNKYFKTLVYYFLIAFAVSGASYVAGDLISKLLKSIESSDSTPAAIAMSTSNTGRSFFY